MRKSFLRCGDFIGNAALGKWTRQHVRIRFRQTFFKIGRSIVYCIFLQGEVVQTESVKFESGSGEGQFSGAGSELPGAGDGQTDGVPRHTADTLGQSHAKQKGTTLFSALKFLQI